MSDKSVGCVVQNPINRELYLNIGTIGRGSVLFPLRYPEVDVATSYNIGIYKELASSLEEHVKNQVYNAPEDAESNLLLAWSTERWEEYLESIIEVAEAFAEDYDFAYIAPEFGGENEAKLNFYEAVKDHILKHIRETVWCTNPATARIAVESFLNHVEVDMAEIFENTMITSWSKALEVEFTERCAVLILTRLDENNLFEMST